MKSLYLGVGVISVACAFYLGAELSGSLANIGVAVYALFVAFCAFFLSIFEGMSNRHHNILSVKPVLNFSCSVFSDISNIAKIQLMNNGTGPAFITKYEISFDGKPLNPTRPEAWSEVVSSLKLKIIFFTPYVITDDCAIREGSAIDLIKFDVATNEVKDSYTKKIEYVPVNTPEEVAVQFKRFSLKVTYESIYENEFKKTFAGLDRD